MTQYLGDGTDESWTLFNGDIGIGAGGSDYFNIVADNTTVIWKVGDGTDGVSLSAYSMTLRLEGWTGPSVVDTSGGIAGDWAWSVSAIPVFSGPGGPGGLPGLPGFPGGGGSGPTSYEYVVTFANSHGGGIAITETARVIAGNINVLNTDGVICFYPGTLIATPTGPRAIETLAIGDLVLTTEGDAMPVRWMGRQTVSTTFADKRRTLPVRISAGALGGGLPQRDLLVSPRHALFLDGILVEAGALIGLPGIAQETDVPVNFTYYHVELADHSLILAEGVAAETFVDNASRENFDNWAEHEALYGHLPQIEELDTPRAQSFRQLPRALKARLGALQAA